MAIDFSCPNCGQTYHVPEAMAGRKGRCQKCGTIAPIPLPVANPAPAPAPAPDDSDVYAIDESVPELPSAATLAPPILKPPAAKKKQGKAKSKRKGSAGDQPNFWTSRRILLPLLVLLGLGLIYPIYIAFLNPTQPPTNPAQAPTARETPRIETQVPPPNLDDPTAPANNAMPDTDGGPPAPLNEPPADPPGA